MQRKQKHGFNIGALSHRVTGSVGNNLLRFFVSRLVILCCKPIPSSTQHIDMNDLVERLVKEAGLTQQQAQKAIETIAGFVKEKFPMLGGAVDQVFAAGSNGDEA